MCHHRTDHYYTHIVAYVASLTTVYFLSLNIFRPQLTTFNRNMSARLPNTSTSAHDELLILLRWHIPPNMEHNWHRFNQLHTILERGGGLTSLPKTIITSAMRSNQQNQQFIEKNKYWNKNYCCFAPKKI